MTLSPLFRSTGTEKDKTPYLGPVKKSAAQNGKQAVRAGAAGLLSRVDELYGNAHGSGNLRQVVARARDIAGAARVNLGNSAREVERRLYLERGVDARIMASSADLIGAVIHKMACFVDHVDAQSFGFISTALREGKVALKESCPPAVKEMVKKAIAASSRMIGQVAARFEEAGLKREDGVRFASDTIVAAALILPMKIKGGASLIEAETGAQALTAGQAAARYQSAVKAHQKVSNILSALEMQCGRKFLSEATLVARYLSAKNAWWKRISRTDGMSIDRGKDALRSLLERREAELNSFYAVKSTWFSFEPKLEAERKGRRAMAILERLGSEIAQRRALKDSAFLQLAAMGSVQVLLPEQSLYTRALAGEDAYLTTFLDLICRYPDEFRRIVAPDARISSYLGTHALSYSEQGAHSTLIRFEDAGYERSLIRKTKPINEIGAEALHNNFIRDLGITEGRVPQLLAVEQTGGDLWHLYMTLEPGMAIDLQTSCRAFALASESPSPISLTSLEEGYRQMGKIDGAISSTVQVPMKRDEAAKYGQQLIECHNSMQRVATKMGFCLPYTSANIQQLDRAFIQNPGFFTVYRNSKSFGNSLWDSSIQQATQLTPLPGKPLPGQPAVIDVQPVGLNLAYARNELERQYLLPPVERATLRRAYYDGFWITYRGEDLGASQLFFQVYDQYGLLQNALKQNNLSGFQHILDRMLKEKPQSFFW